MKKLFFAIAAMAIISLTSCKKSSPADETVRILDETTVKIENASSMQQVEKIGTEMGNELTELSKKYPDFKPNEEEQKRMEEAALKLAQAQAAAFNKLASPEAKKAVEEITNSVRDKVVDETINNLAPEDAAAGN